MLFKRTKIARDYTNRFVRRNKIKKDNVCLYGNKKWRYAARKNGIGFKEKNIANTRFYLFDSEDPCRNFIKVDV